MEEQRKYRNMPVHPMLFDFSVDTQEGNLFGVGALKTGKLFFHRGVGDKSYVLKDKSATHVIYQLMVQLQAAESDLFDERCHSQELRERD